VLCDLPWGGVIQEGSTVTAYDEITPIGKPTACDNHKETRTCTGGILSGSYTNQTCNAPQTIEEAIHRILVKNAGKVYHATSPTSAPGYPCPLNAGGLCTETTKMDLDVTVPATPGSQVQVSTTMTINVYNSDGTVWNSAVVATTGLEVWTGAEGISGISYSYPPANQPSGKIWKHWAGNPTNNTPCLNGLIAPPYLDENSWSWLSIYTCYACNSNVVTNLGECVGGYSVNIQ
jgi:hypothetical protein